MFKKEFKSDYTKIERGEQQNGLFNLYNESIEKAVVETQNLQLITQRQKTQWLANVNPRNKLHIGDVNFLDSIK